MSFREIPARPFNVAPVRQTLQVALRRTRKGRAVLLEIKISGDIVETLGWRRGQRVKLLFGEDQDAGRLMIAPGGGLRLIRPNVMARVVTSRLPDALRYLAHPVTDCPWEILDGGRLLIALPFATPAVTAAEAAQ